MALHLHALQNCSDPRMKLEFTVRCLPGTDTSSYSHTLAKALTSLGSVGGLAFCDPDPANATISTELQVGRAALLCAPCNEKRGGGGRKPEGRAGDTAVCTV